jgi:dTDP-4-dehydrorhamnose 3,5-epimerase
MRMIETPLKGAYVIEIEKIVDERGFFSRSWCQKEFYDAGLVSDLVQCNISYNHRKGTLRGMHYQLPPYEETKLVRCTKGAIYDVIIDIRPQSSSYLKWFGVELSEMNYKMLYIPKGFAHGFQTLEDQTEVFYQMSDWFHAESSRGISWDDAVFGIDWPFERKRIISDKDMNYGDFKNG